jgi:hypothetical protein
LEKPDFYAMRRELQKIADDIGGKINFDEYQTKTEGFFKAVYTVKYVRKDGQIKVLEPVLSSS